MSSLGIFDKKTKTYKKIAGLAEAAVVDDALSSTSTNPVQNKVVTSNLDGLGYGENGAKNLFEDEIKWMENINIERGTKSVSDGKITLTATSNDCYTEFGELSWKNNGIKTIPCKQNTTYTFSWEYEGDALGDVYIFENSSTNNMRYAINKNHKLSITTSASAEYLTVRVGVQKIGDSITYWNFQIEEGTQATSYEPYIPSVKMLEDEKADKSETTVNLLKPTLQTTTQNGVTCTANGDGTYTLNGTATENVSFYVGTISTVINNGKTFKLTGCSVGGSPSTYEVSITDGVNPESVATDYGTGAIKTIKKFDNIDVVYMFIIIKSGVTLNNVVFKPMITTNLSATYEDFVPYTGDTGKLNGDVAALKADVANNKTVVDTSMSDTSTNPVQNKVIKKYVDDHAPNITVDDALSKTSTNPVQNKVVTSNLTDLKNATTVNLLNPTLGTTTQDGITCTNNGDGTYTLNGTVNATSNRAVIVIQNCADMIKKHLNEDLLLIGCPKHDESIDIVLHLDCGPSHATDHGNGKKFKFSQVLTSAPLKIEIGPNGTTVNNIVFKPMLTTNLNATYDDFVSYTGDTGKLNGDVAGLAKKAKFERNNSIFPGSYFLTGDTAGRFGASSYGWSSTEGHVIEFNNAKDEKTNCAIWVDIPANSVLFLQAYSPNGAPVEVKSPLLFYNEKDTVTRETISCDVTAPIGTTNSIAFNPIVIKNV